MSNRTFAQGLVITGQVTDLPEASYAWLLTAMQHNGPALVAMLWRILGNEQDVADAYQSTFLQLAHVAHGRRPRNLKAYLFRTAANIAVSILRATAAQRKAIHAVGQNRSKHAVIETPGQELDQAALADQLRMCIARLPENLRQVLVLRDMADLSYTQIRSIMGISAQSARVYRCKAIKLLAAWMDKKT